MEALVCTRNPLTLSVPKSIVIEGDSERLERLTSGVRYVFQRSIRRTEPRNGGNISTRLGDFVSEVLACRARGWMRRGLGGVYWSFLDMRFCWFRVVCR